MRKGALKPVAMKVQYPMGNHLDWVLKGRLDRGPSG